MKLILERYSSGKEDTIGRLYIDGKLYCRTLEDQYREIKVKTDTRIPEGIYKIILRKEGTHHVKYAKRFGKMHKGTLWLQAVKGFQYILIHCGNTDADTAGCILVGEDVTGTDKNKRRRLNNSEAAYKTIYPIIAKALEDGEEVTIKIFTHEE